MTSDLLNGDVKKTLVSFSTPFMLGMLLQTLYATTDTIVVGQVLGSAGLSAVSNAGQLMQLMYILCVGFSNAGQTLIAQARGAGDDALLEKVTGNLFLAEIVLSIVMGGICVCFDDALLRFLATPEEAFVQAGHYIRICGAGMLFTGFYNMLSAVLRGVGDSRHPLLFVAIASGVNIVLDLLFVAVLHMDVAGAALATVIGQAVSVWFSLTFLKKNASALGIPLRRKSFRFDAAVCGTLVRIGLPMSLQSGSILFSFLFVNRLVNSLGVVVSAAFGVAQKLRQIPGIITQGLSLGAGAMMGQNLGAGNPGRVSSTVKWTIVLAALVNGAAGLVFLLFPGGCFRLFTQDAAVLAYAVMCMMTLLIELPGKSFMSGCNTLINAQGFVKLSFVIAIVDAFAGRVLLSWLLGIRLGLGAAGFMAGYSLATYVSAIPGIVYYFSGLWKRRAALAGTGR